MKKMTNIAIVVVGYNRDKSLLRLLSSLSKADYDSDNVTLIISIDKSDNYNVVDIANNYEWHNGDKIVNIQTNKLGLRNHVLKCGNLAFDYGSIIVLEDDLYVSPDFYNYAKQSIIKYKNNDKIAGISLYSHSWNVNCLRPFIPADDGTDAYFLQFAQSWGQVWTNVMWKGFIEWYGINSGKIDRELDMPASITSWPDSSWLKYYIRYLVKTNSFFVYPRISLVTNFGDKGQHAIEPSSNYQVPILLEIKKEYKFPVFDDESIRYDVFFERIGIGKKLGLPEEDVCMDLYSTKSNNQKKRYWITTEHVAHKIHSSFGLYMRPHEINIYYEIEGSDIYCYDTSVINENIFCSKYKSTIKTIKYDLRDTDRKFILMYSCYLYKTLFIYYLVKLLKLLKV